MTITSVYAGADQADVATLTVGGVTYHCFVWRAGAGARVEAKIFAEGEDGQMVLVDASIVASNVSTAVDCPRVLAVSDGGATPSALFVVHWIDYTQGPVAITSASLFRALFDISTFSAGWALQGAVSLHVSLLYDHAAIAGDTDGEFVVARRTAAGIITVDRYAAPWTWVDTDWSTAVAALTIDDAILGCAADSTDDVVLFSYQDTNTLRTQRLSASVGTAGGNEVTSGTFDGSTEHQYTAVTHGRYAANRWLVLAESRPDSYAVSHARRVIARCINSSTAVALHQLQWVWNVHILSRAWAWATGTDSVTEIHCALSFKSIDDGQEFDQQYGYVVRWEVAAFDGASQATVRPIPLAALMDGSIDARPHGTSPAGSLTIGCRTNHISHAPGPPQYTLGPNIKTKLFACTRWGRLLASQDADSDSELAPVEAGIGWVRFFHEPAWSSRRDASEPAQPDTPNWRGAAQSIAQPVETPAGLVLTGGVAGAYDGECLVPLGFLWTPEIIDVLVVAGTVGDAGDYTWYVNFAWPDNRGGYHRGPPSRPITATLAANSSATLTVRCMNLDLKDDARRYPLNSPIVVEVWRTYFVSGSLVTEGTGSTQAYLFRSEYGGQNGGSTLQDIPTNDPDAFTIEIPVGSANSVVRFNEIAPYQLNLDTLQFTPPPPIPHQPLGSSCLWKNRLAGVDPGSNSFVWSEPILPIGPRYRWPYFLDTNVLRLDAVGRIVAVASLDYAVVLFARDAIFTVTGEPGAGGTGTSLDLQLVTRGIGCVEPLSVVSTHVGTFFQSAKGLHLVDRGLQLQYPGAPVEALVARAGNLRGAAHLEDRHLVAWAFNEEAGTGPLVVRPRLLVYNYSTDRWSVWEYPATGTSSTASRLNEMVGVAAWRGRQGQHVLALLQQSGLAIERSVTDTTYADEGAAATVAVSITLQTEWLLLAEAAGVYRTRELGIVTDRINASGMAADLYFDTTGVYDESGIDQTVTWASPAPAYLPIKPSTQRLSGVMLVIRESSPASTENVRIKSLMVRWMPKPYPRRPAGSTIGA